MDDIDLMPTLAEGQIAMATEPVPAVIEGTASPIEKLKAADEARDGFPGEHWIVLALGIAVWQVTRKDPRWYVRMAGGFAATSLVARAATGRQGLSRVLRYTPFGKGISNCPPCTQERLQQQGSGTH